MDKSIRLLRVIQGAFIIAVLMYAAIAELVFGSRVTPARDMQLFNIFALVALAALLAGFHFRRKILARAANELRADANSASGLASFRLAHFVSMTFAEAIALFGFVLRALGYEMQYAIPFFVVSLALLLVWGPRRLEVV